MLVALGSGPGALLAAFRYLILGSIGATFFLIGVGLLYMMTGTLNMADLSVRIDEVSHTRTVAAGVVFVVLGMGLKAAVFPLHAWLPAAYAQAPSSAAAFLAGTSTKVSIYVLARFLFDLFGVDLAFERLGFGTFLIALAIAGVLAGSAVAVFQGSVKRLLAWSSIAQLGYMILGLGLATAGGIAASVLHLFNHAVMKVALFLAVGNLVYRVGSDALDNLTGLGRRMPWTMGAFLVAAMSLVGVPLTAGFVSKWYLLRAALADGMWPIAIVILVSSLLAAIYMWAGGEHRVLHRGPSRYGAGTRPRGALDDGRTGGRAGGGQRLVRGRDVVQRRVRGARGRGVLRSLAVNSPPSRRCRPAMHERNGRAGPRERGLPARGGPKARDCSWERDCPRGLEARAPGDAPYGSRVCGTADGVSRSRVAATLGPEPAR